MRRAAGEIARQRLKIIFENTDGFRDRPPGLADTRSGRIRRARQSGVPLLRYADLELDADLVDMAREVAETMLVEHPALAEKHLQRWLRLARGAAQVLTRRSQAAREGVAPRRRCPRSGFSGRAAPGLRAAKSCRSVSRDIGARFR